MVFTAKNFPPHSFKHIRILARAFTYRSAKGILAITGGNNQRLEFLGDALCSLIVSDYLFRHYPYHHEGHLTLLRCCLVGGQTQAQVSQELGLVNYVITTIGQGHNPSITMANWKHKQLADLFEAFIAAIYIDSDSFDYCRAVFESSFYPRLKEFIIQQSWNDPKSRLQQCCLTLREENQEPTVPRYTVINKEGPTHKTEYEVSVVFKGKEIGRAFGRSIQDAEMQAAKKALKDYYFPQREWQQLYVNKKYDTENKIKKAYHDRISIENIKAEELKAVTNYETPKKEYDERDFDGRPRDFQDPTMSVTGGTYKYMISSSGKVTDYEAGKTQTREEYLAQSVSTGRGISAHTIPHRPAALAAEKKRRDMFDPQYSQDKTQNISSLTSYLYNDVDRKSPNFQVSAPVKVVSRPKPQPYQPKSFTLTDRQNSTRFGRPSAKAASFIDRYGNVRYFGETEEKQRKYGFNGGNAQHQHQQSQDNRNHINRQHRQGQGQGLIQGYHHENHTKNSTFSYVNPNHPNFNRSKVQYPNQNGSAIQNMVNEFDEFIVSAKNASKISPSNIYSDDSEGSLTSGELSVNSDYAS